VSKTDLWMPLYVGDYLADTGHLTTTQHGAYLLLLMHYWRKRELPDDDKQLAAIAKLPLRIWLDCRETIQAFFHVGWKHKRLDAELQKRAEVACKRAAAGQKGGSRAQMNHMLRAANAPVCLSKTQSPILRTSSSDVESQRGPSNGLTLSAAALAIGTRR
jgi:uncharacterized protein YdaU (DUF1376 family)